jgi:hypothetical protein
VQYDTDTGTETNRNHRARPTNIPKLSEANESIPADAVSTSIIVLKTIHISMFPSIRVRRASYYT